MDVSAQLVLGRVAAVTPGIDAPERLQAAVVPVLVQRAVRLPHERLPAPTLTPAREPYSLHTYGLLRVWMFCWCRCSRASCGTPCCTR